MLSSSANYTPSSQNSQTDDHQFHSHSLVDYYSFHPPSRSTSVPAFTHSSSPHLSTDTNLFSNDDAFLIKYNENIIVSPTNTSSPSKYRVLNTPERVCEEDYLIFNSFFFFRRMLFVYHQVQDEIVLSKFRLFNQIKSYAVFF